MSAFTISFGVPGSEQAWYFRNGPDGFRPIDISRLPGPAPEFSNVSRQLTMSYVAEGFSGQLLYARRVQGSEVEGVDTFDQLGDWNTVKNLQLLSGGAQTMVLDGFVHVDAEVGLLDTAGSTLVLNGTKRANVITGEGADTIDIRMVSDVNSIWVDTFRVNSGGGDDLVSFTGLDIAAELAAGDKTYIQAANKPGLALDPTGDGRTTYTALGTGDDRFIGFTSDDHIAGQEDRGTVMRVLADRVTGSFAYAVGGSTAKGGCDSILYKVDLKTGAATQVGKVAIGLGWFGSVGGLDIESLALSPKDGQLYGFASKFGILDALVRIDPLTAKTTYIKLNCAGLRADMQDMAFDAAGNLFLVANGDLMKVNTATGGIFTIGNNTLNCNIGAMTIDTADRVLAIGDEGGKPVLYEINKLNGKVLSASKLTGFDKCPAIEALSFDASGALIAIDRDSGGIYTVNLVTKAATLTGKTLSNAQQYGDGFEAMAIQSVVEKVTVDLTASGGDAIRTGAGADHVYYEVGDGVDRIADFAVGTDTLHIGGYTAADLQIDTFDGDTFIRFKDASADGFVDDAVIELTGVASFDPTLIVFTVPDWV